MNSRQSQHIFRAINGCIRIKMTNNAPVLLRLKNIAYAVHISKIEYVLLLQRKINKKKEKDSKYCTKKPVFNNILFIVVNQSEINNS